MPKKTYIINQFHGGSIGARNKSDLKPEEHMILENIDLHRTGAAIISTRFKGNNVPWHNSSHPLSMAKHGRGFFIGFADIDPYEGKPGKYEVMLFENGSHVEIYILNAEDQTAFASTDSAHTGWFKTGNPFGTDSIGTGPFDMIKVENQYFISSCDHSAPGTAVMFEIIRENRFSNTSIDGVRAIKSYRELTHYTYTGMAQLNTGNCLDILIGGSGTSPSSHFQQIVWDVSFGSAGSGSWNINVDTDGGGTRDSYVKLYATVLYTNDAESYPVYMRSMDMGTGGHDGAGNGYDGSGSGGSAFGSIGARELVKLQIHCWMSCQYSGTPTGEIYGWHPDQSDLGNRTAAVKGTVLYYSTVNNATGEETEMVRLAVADANLGLKVDTDTDFTPWTNASTGHGHNNVGIQQEVESLEPPLLNTYEIVHGFRLEDVYNYNSADPHFTLNKSIMWKCSTVANGRLFVGNVQYDGKNYPDRVYKSALFEYGMFPKQNYLEVVPADGDEIINIETLGDSLLVFKEQTMYLISTAKEIEVLQNEYPGMGCSSWGAVCKFEKGIAWANRTGLYVFDGESVTNLIEGKLEVQDGSFGGDGQFGYWQVSPKDVSLGYNADRQTLIVKIADIGDPEPRHLIHYCLRGGGFTRTRLGIEYTATTYSNFQLNSNRVLQIATPGAAGNRSGTSIKTLTGSSVMSVFTHETNFGDPSSLKNISKLYANWGATAAAGVMDLNISISFDGGNSYNNVESNITLYSATASSTVEWSNDLPLISPSIKRGIKTCIVKLQGTVPGDFRLEDITIVYRELGKR